MKLPVLLLAHSIPQSLWPSDLRIEKKVALRVARNRAELRALISDADGLITLFKDPVDAKLLARAKRLRVVANIAVGIDNIDLKTCQKQGVRVINTPDVLTRATAELTLALLLAAARRVPEGESLTRPLNRNRRFKGWELDMLLGLELKGRHAVLVGKGRIGKETAKLFNGIGLHVSWVTRRDSQTMIESKLRKAQVLSLHFPLNADTKHWLNARRLSLLPRDAIVLNTTRGPVIDERALIRALHRRHIFAAGLDVYEHEPRIPAALRKLPNVVLLPHLGSATWEARRGMVRLALQGALGILSGKQPPNEVNFFGLL